MQNLNRNPPGMPPENYKTFQIAAPINTHWRLATCEEAGCEAYQNGWRTTVDESSALGAFQADYIRHDKSRRHLEDKQPDGMTVFTFPAGQTCFGGEHRVPLDREERFLITGGDWRGNPRGTPRVELRSDQWVDDFACHQDRLKTAFERG